MTKKEFVELLSKYPDNAIVEFYDRDTDDTYPLVEIIYEEEENKIIL